MVLTIVVLALLVCAWAAGWILFRKKTIPVYRHGPLALTKLSVIIPARNEERNLPHLLSSLLAQSFKSLEMIVVDDHSEDRTREVAESFGVRVIASTPLPPGWTGKNWAIWNGYAHATGDVIAFLDADVRLAPNALHALLAAREQAGGTISVVPYHFAERLYEKLALTINLLGLFAFTSPMERTNPKKGLYGSCIVTSRADYEQVNGHEGIKSELLDDLNLGARFVEAGIPVVNYIGHGLVSFRMYPGGFRSEVEGFSKGAVLSTSKLNIRTTMLVALWLIGLIAAEAAPFVLATPLALPFSIGFLFYTAQIYYFVHFTGRFGKWFPLFHAVSTVFFLFIMLYSVYQVVFLGKVDWKGRQISVGGRKSP